LRAAIASEVSFAERLIRKTGVSEIDYVFAFSNLPRATTACSEVKDEFMRKGTDYGMTVSYTHLDVYKRQHMDQE